MLDASYEIKHAKQKVRSGIGVGAPIKHSMSTPAPVLRPKHIVIDFNFSLTITYTQSFKGLIVIF